MLGMGNDIGRMFDALDEVVRLQGEITGEFIRLVEEDPEEMIRLQESLIDYYMVALQSSKRRRAYAERVAREQAANSTTTE